MALWTSSSTFGIRRSNQRNKRRRSGSNRVMRFQPGNGAFLACVLALGLAITAIATQQNPSGTTLTDIDLKEVEIQFQRSTCYGSCPSYKLSIHGDGRVEYEGLKFVKREGHKEGKLSSADLRRLVSQFEKAQFLSIDQFSEKSCTCTVCTDMPTVITELRARGISHRVEHYYGCRCAPKSLWDLEETIDKIARTEQWTGDVSKQGPFGTTCFNR